jgi:hypothetical protein
LNRAIFVVANADVSVGHWHRFGTALFVALLTLTFPTLSSKNDDDDDDDDDDYDEGGEYRQDDDNNVGTFHSLSTIQHSDIGRRQLNDT